MTKGKLLFLDFDGVVCNSVNETIVSSWLAYYKYVKNRLPASMTRDHKKRFMRLRPYIRSGEDYLLIQDIMANNLRVTNQNTFDGLLKAAGERTMEYYKTVFYRARREIMKAHKRMWLDLNPLYPHMYKVMERARTCKNVYIVSAKKIVYIREILKDNGLEFKPGRIIHAEQEQKTDIIGRVLDRGKKRSAYFIDDQLSHLSANRDPRIKPLLASWGYVDRRWLKQKEVECIDPTQMQRLIYRIVNDTPA